MSSATVDTRPSPPASSSWKRWAVLTFALGTLVALARVALTSGAPTSDAPPTRTPLETLDEVDSTTAAPSSTALRATRASSSAPITIAATGVVGVAKLSPGYNPSVCGRQPNTTTIDWYPGCPIPGLNNLLYTQHNRWYCIYRDKSVVTLRDRTCNKGSHEKYRYTTLLQVRYDRMAAFHAWSKARVAAGMQPPQFGNSKKGGKGGLLTVIDTSGPAAVVEAASKFAALMQETAPHVVPHVEPSSGPVLCWADINEKVLPPRCEWSDIPRFHGTPEWWEARTFIDLHPEYYVAVQRLLQAHVGSRPFISVHLRRGDFQHHCTVLKRKKQPPTVQFWSVPTLVSADGLATGSCYPTLDEIRAGFHKMVAASGVRLLGLATNDPDEMAPLLTPMHKVTQCLETSAPWCAFVLPKITAENHPLIGGRKLDALVMDIVMLASGSHFIFNRWSSFSGTAFEIATIHGRTNTSNVRCW